MWRQGQLVTLWGKVYRISKSAHNEKYKTCMLCQQCNMRTPCIDGFDYPEKTGFDMRMCFKRLKPELFPKRVTGLHHYGNSGK